MTNNLSSIDPSLLAAVTGGAETQPHPPRAPRAPRAPRGGGWIGTLYGIGQAVYDNWDTIKGAAKKAHEWAQSPAAEGAHHYPQGA